MNYFKLIRILIIIVSSLVIFLLFTLIVLFGSYNIVSVITEKNPGVKKSEIYDYQFFRLDPHTNEKNVGFTQLPQYLDKNEYIFYEEDGGGLVLVSNFGENEYICTGSCSCDETSSERRLSGSLVKQSISYLVVAASSIFAVKSAKEYFEHECVNKMSESCDESHVISEMDECEARELLDKFDDLLDDLDDGLELNIESLEGKYICKGYCLPNQDETVKEAYFGDLTEYCDTIGLGTLWDFRPDEINLGLEQIKHAKFSGLTPSQVVQFNFAGLVLDKICKESSQMPVEKSDEIEHTFGCVGFHVFEGGINADIHEETRCKKVS